jgi:L-methionine (R)-S-oxide reductase
LLVLVSCLILRKKLKKEPFDLTTVFPRGGEFDFLIYRLNAVVQLLADTLKMEWVGIYLVSKVDNSLVKVAYHGSPSRPFFPLTEDFAKGSSNSTVGLTGKIKIINSVSDNTDGYYECDVRVQSEVCLPILDDFQNVIGIIDAEAHSKISLIKTRSWS